MKSADCGFKSSLHDFGTASMNLTWLIVCDWTFEIKAVPLNEEEDASCTPTTILRLLDEPLDWLTLIVLI